MKLTFLESVKHREWESLILKENSIFVLPPNVHVFSSFRFFGFSFTSFYLTTYHCYGRIMKVEEIYEKTNSLCFITGSGKSNLILQWIFCLKRNSVIFEEDSEK